MLSTSRLLRNSLRMRHILCRQVLLQICDGGGEKQRREGLQGEREDFYVKSAVGRGMEKPPGNGWLFPSSHDEKWRSRSTNMRQ